MDYAGDGIALHAASKSFFPVQCYKKSNMQRLKDLKEVTKAVLSVYNAGVATLMYAYGAPAFDLVSGGYLAGGSCKTYASPPCLQHTGL